MHYYYVTTDAATTADLSAPAVRVLDTWMEIKLLALAFVSCFLFLFLLAKRVFI